MIPEPVIQAVEEEKPKPVIDSRSLIANKWIGWETSQQMW